MSQLKERNKRFEIWRPMCKWEPDKINVLQIVFIITIVPVLISNILHIVSYDISYACMYNSKSIRSDAT